MKVDLHLEVAETIDSVLSERAKIRRAMLLDPSSIQLSHLKESTTSF